MRILVIANDVTPEFGLPVAAPGLRAWSLALGLRAHGHQVQVVVNDGPLHRVGRGDVPPSAEDVVPMSPAKLDGYVATHEPDAVVFTNSNHVHRLSPGRDCLIVYDFFAPQLLEYGFGDHPDGIDLGTLQRLRDRKVDAMRRVDVIALNGAKKKGYALAWLLQTDRDPRSVPIVDVPFGVPVHEPRPHDGPLRLAVAGYLQPWSGAGSWLDQLLATMDTVDVEVHLVLAQHWGGADVDVAETYGPLLEHESTVLHDPLPFDAFRDLIASVDATIDLFDHHLEREYAMVTRTLVALCTGAAVIHPDYTEVADLVRRYGAGWLLGRNADVGLADLCRRLAKDRDEVMERRLAAARLAREVLDPVEATAELSEKLEKVAR